MTDELSIQIRRLIERLWGEDASNRVAAAENAVAALVDLYHEWRGQEIECVGPGNRKEAMA